MASLRRKLISCNAMFLNEVWEKTHTLVKGGNEHVLFEMSIRKDVIAYTILQMLENYSCYAFGGFVRSHFSGKPWNDLDIVIPNNLSEVEMWRKIIRFLTFVLPIAKKNIKHTYSRKAYASRRTLCVRETHTKMLLLNSTSCDRVC